MKFFYYIGIYAFCVTVHKTINSIPDCLNAARKAARQIKQIKDVCTDKDDEKSEGFKPKKVVNRIGF